jgi:hypothetical protein
MNRNPGENQVQQQLTVKDKIFFENDLGLA